MNASYTAMGKTKSIFLLMVSVVAFVLILLVIGFLFNLLILKVSSPNREFPRMKLRKECDAGRIVGPFRTPPFANFRTSPLGVVPKKDPSEFRLIHHLSYPKGNSVNDAIPDYCSSVKYASVSDAITAIKATGEGCFLAKTDIKSAFRIIPIHPADNSLLGTKCHNLVPPHGSSSST